PRRRASVFGEAGIALDDEADAGARVLLERRLVDRGAVGAGARTLEHRRAVQPVSDRATADRDRLMQCARHGANHTPRFVRPRNLLAMVRALAEDGRDGTAPR